MRTDKPTIKTPLTRPDIIGLLIVAIFLVIAWHHTFVEMWHRWFPAWNFSSLSLLERFTEGDSYYTHGPLVPLVSLLVAFFIYRRVGTPISRTRWATIIGWMMLIDFLLIHLMSVYARVTFVSGFALVGVLGGLALWWGGWPLARAYWIPITLLVFMVPLPMNWIADLNFELKILAGRAALWLTNEVFHVPAIMDGSYVYLTPDAQGHAKTLIVENVCSGLRSLISLVWFASLFAVVCRIKGLGRWTILALAVPLAIGCNIVRITSLNLMAHYVSVEAAGTKSWFHDFSGLMVFGLAMAVLLGFEKAIIATNRQFKRNWKEPRLLDFLDKLPIPVSTKPAKRSPIPIGVLALAAVLSVIWSQQTVAQQIGGAARRAVPDTLTLDQTTLAGRDLELDQRTLIILETDDYIYRRYSDQVGQAKVDLLIVFSANNRKGTHPPEVCLEGGGQHIVQKQIQKIEAKGIGQMLMREVVSQQDTRLDYHLYVYKCGDQYTANFFTQQATIFFNSLTARNSTGALIRLTVPIVHQDVEAARRLALEAAKTLMPHIDRGLP